LSATARAQEGPAPRFVDLSLLVTSEYPCTWPTFPRFQIIAQDRIGPLSAYNSDVLIIDGNTGTQLDVPPHSVTPPDSGFSNAGEFGRSYTDVVPAWQFGGEACVIDGRDLVDGPGPGRSHLIGADRVKAWERSHRPLGAGDAVLFASGYTDRFYRPMPAGRRFAADPVEGKSPAWPGPDPGCMEYLAGRKVMTLGIDSTSMGPLPDLAEPFRRAQARHDLGREPDRAGPAPGYRRVLRDARAEVRRRHLQRVAGLRDRRRPAGPPADRLRPQEERR
jgi:kynurenine formamidase